MTKEEMIKILEDGDCCDPFCCPFGMYGQAKNGNWGCFAQYPHGDPNEEPQKCIIHQAADMLKEAL